MFSDHLSSRLLSFFLLAAPVAMILGSPSPAWPLSPPAPVHEDVFGNPFGLDLLTGRFRIFLFFSRRNQERYQELREQIFRDLYEHDELDIILVMQKPGTHLLARRKTARELADGFAGELEARQAHLGALENRRGPLPGFYFILDLEGTFSESLGVAAHLKEPSVFLLNQDNEPLAFFDTASIDKGLQDLCALGLLRESTLQGMAPLLEGAPPADDQAAPERSSPQAR